MHLFAWQWLPRRLLLNEMPIVWAIGVYAFITIGSVGDAHAERPVRLVVAIGANVGLVNEEPLKYAGRDAKRMAQAFVSLGGVKREHVFVTSRGTVSVFEAALTRAAQTARRIGSKNVSLVIYYSGHGDKQSLHLSGRRLALSRLRAAAARVPAALRVTIIDACRTTGASRGKGIALSKPFSIDLDQSDIAEGSLSVFSSSGGEAAQESDQLRGAIFTHFFLSAMRGAADRNRDTQVTFDEAYQYAYHRTLIRSASSAGALQHPSVRLRLKQSRPIVLTRLAKPVASIGLPAERDVQYFVYDAESAAVMAEVWSHRLYPTAVALGRGRYVVHRRAPGRYAAAEVNLSYGGKKQLKNRDFKAFGFEQLARKGAHVFERPHQLGIDALFSVDRHRLIGFGAALRYRYLFSQFAAEAAIEFGGGGRSVSLYRIRERWFGGDASIQWRPFRHMVSMHVGIGASLRVLQQRSKRRDGEQLARAGIDASWSMSALAAGPLLQLGVSVPVFAHWSLGLRLTGRGFFLREDNKLTFRPAFSTLLGVALAF